MKIDISCQILVTDTFLTQIARFQLATLYSSRKHDFQAILSYKVKIDILCEIFVTDTVTNEIACFHVATLCCSRKHDFEAILSYEVKIDIFHVRFWSLIRFRAKSGVFYWLHSVEAEKHDF